ncbi:MAG: glycosyltransferase [Chloroflexota bacterium]
MAAADAAPLLSVIVPVRADPRLADCLAALRRQSLDRDGFEIVVADNEPAEAVRLLAARFEARYVAAPEGGSYAARARGAAEARGDVLVFTDADCVAPRDWLAAIDKLFTDPECLVAIGPSSGTNRSTVARWVHAIDEDRWNRLRTSNDVAFCDTRNLAIRRDVLMVVPFDPLFRQAGDVDLGVRLFARGIPIRLEPSMVVVHDDPTSLRLVLRRGIRRGRGVALLERKHGDRFAGSIGARPLRIGRWDAKATVLRWGRRTPFRQLIVGVSWCVIAALFTALSVVARLPGGAGRTGLRAFVVFERLTLLIGRLSG